MPTRPDHHTGQQGSILLPVILLLLLVATAATAMTIQARTSLREASTRRDRLSLGVAADAAVRAVALAMAQAAVAKAAPPFSLDGSSQSCRMGDGRRLDLSIQDEGGLVDLNKALPDLVQTVLSKAVQGSDAITLTKAILAHRSDATVTKTPARQAPQNPRRPGPASVEAHDFVAADEVGDLPGMTPALFDRLRPLFTTLNRSAGIDPQVAGPALRAIIPSKELTSPAFEAMTTPSMHSDFTVTAVVFARSGQRFARRASFRLDPDAGALGRFMAWEAPPFFDLPVVETMPSAFCQRVADALAEG